MIVLNSNQNHATAYDTETCPTLPEAMGMGGGHIPMIIETFGFKPGQGSAAQGLGYGKEVAPTLNTSSSCGGGNTWDL